MINTSLGDKSCLEMTLKPLSLAYSYCIQIRNEKARRYLGNMKKKHPVPFSQKFPGVDPMALHLLERLLAFDPNNRPTAAEVGNVQKSIARKA
jgi:serine/threonine protein kinase